MQQQQHTFGTDVIRDHFIPWRGILRINLGWIFQQIISTNPARSINLPRVTHIHTPYIGRSSLEWLMTMAKGKLLYNPKPLNFC